MLELGKNVYANYKVVSLPYDNKSQAYADIAIYWRGEDCTTYFDKENGQWYIILAT